ncbi:hypothetical protein D9613_000113 [Agrocybe pediades]|uniref:Uncharacterized protein n=1 Tax=Agrocybe pediades TaxID=84607 RepID=A0A8H4VU36_9AGAR|nr:hypothetical protein D9613_000113 [Agrocybe pediades]
MASSPSVCPCTVSENETTEWSVVLPYEVERMIFELAATKWPGSAVTLSTVSRYVQGWVEGILYHTVVLDCFASYSKTRLFQRTLRSRPKSFFKHHVKRLYMDVTFKESQELLECCTGVTHLVLPWADHFMIEGSMADLPFPPKLDRLSIRLESLDVSRTRAKRSFSPGLFANLTHLEFITPLCEFVEIDWYSLCPLPTLTHFAVGILWGSRDSHFLPPLEYLINELDLTVMVIISFDLEFLKLLEESILMDDHRVVVKSDLNSTDKVPPGRYWNQLKHGCPEFWDSAEEMMKQQRRKGKQRWSEMDLQSVPVCV